MKHLTNIYWPVYKNLEFETLDLTYNIHIDDNQLNVYSSKISDLILRSAIEIESLSKELYFLNGGKDKKNIKFDDDAIKYLNNLWILEKKKIIISSINCFQTDKILTPFEKKEQKQNGKLTYSWNNSYQNLKHDRAKSLNFGSIKYLFEIMSALFILNLYHKNETIELRNGNWDSNLPSTMGSKLFSIKVHTWSSYDSEMQYRKNEDFDECIYLTKYTDETIANNIRGNEKMRQKQIELFKENPKYKEYIKNNKIADYKGNNLIYDVLGEAEYRRNLMIALKEHEKETKNPKYEAILNKNCI